MLFEIEESLSLSEDELISTIGRAALGGLSEYHSLLPVIIMEASLNEPRSRQFQFELEFLLKLEIQFKKIGLDGDQFQL